RHRRRNGGFGFRRLSLGGARPRGRGWSPLAERVFFLPWVFGGQKAGAPGEKRWGREGGGGGGGVDWGFRGGEGEGARLKDGGCCRVVLPSSSRPHDPPRAQSRPCRGPSRRRVRRGRLVRLRGRSRGA